MNEVKYKKKNIIKIFLDIYFFVILGFFLFDRIFTITIWHDSYKIANYIWNKANLFFFGEFMYYVLVCAIARMLVEKKNLIRILICLIIIVVSYNSYKSSGEVYIYIVSLLIISAMGVDAKKILLFSIIIESLILVPTVYAALKGFIINEIEIGRNREYLGFIWTTLPVILFFYIILDWIVIKRGNINLFELLFLSSINIWMFIKTDTRMTFLLFCFYITFFFFIKRREKKIANLKILKKTYLFLPWIAFTFIYILTANYSENNSLMIKLNKVLSNRLRQCKYSLDLYGIRPFGQSIKWVATSNASADNPATYVDTAYLQSMLLYGWIILVIFLIMYSYLLFKSYEKGLYTLLFAIIITIVFGLTEQQMLMIQYNTLLLLSFADISNLKKRRLNYVYTNIIV